jgi:hypothetical protein
MCPRSLFVEPGRELVEGEVPERSERRHSGRAGDRVDLTDPAVELSDGGGVVEVGPLLASVNGALTRRHGGPAVRTHP